MRKSKKNINESKLKLPSNLPGNDVGEVTDYFGMRIVKNSQSISLHQKKNVNTLVSEMGFSEWSASRVPCDTLVDLSTKGEVSGDDSPP